MFAASRFTTTITTTRAAAARYVCRRQLSTSTRLIINAVGEDRLGIVSDITGMVIDAGGNVGESQAAKLGTHFSLMMLVDLPNTKLDDLKATLDKMEDMNAAVFETQETANPVTPQVAYAGMFSLEGADHPGIVHKLTTALAQHGLNIDKMETDQEIAPYGGTLLFRMRGVANAFEPLPKTFDVAQIKEELEELGDSLNCEVHMEDVVDDSASGVFYAG